MTGPYQRRRDPQPMGQGWEVAVAAIGGALFGLGLAALCGLGAASMLFGQGWVWPHGTETIGHVIGELLVGHPGRGLDPRQARLVAGPPAVYLCVAACELAVIAASVVGGVLLARYRRPGDARGGMATRREAQQVLGLRRLLAVSDIIRPDLSQSESPCTPPSEQRIRPRPHPRRPSTDRPEVPCLAQLWPTVKAAASSFRRHLRETS
jgi:hypothetical protein